MTRRAPSFASLVFTSLVAITFWFGAVQAGCVPEYAFLPPSYSPGTLNDTFNAVKKSLEVLKQQNAFNTTSFALEISSSTDTLFKYYHTMPGTDTNNKNASVIDGTTPFRVESNTKLFTSLAILQQEALGHLALDDSVAKYVQNLPINGTAYNWDGITIRALLAHFGGLPNSLADDDLATELSDPTIYGLPPVPNSALQTLPHCGTFSNYTVACDGNDLLNTLTQFGPILPPQVETSYANMGYDLLGLVLANVTGMTYEDYISTSIIHPLGLNNTSFTAPAESAAELPYPSAWGQAVGVDAAAGGIYSSSSDMISFLRHCLLNHRKITPTIDWFSPVAYAVGAHSFLGYTWEIFRSNSLLANSERAVTMLTKGGGGVEYYSYSVVIPAYDLVVFMVAAGDLAALNDVFSTVRSQLVQGAENAAQKNLKATYAGTYSAKACNSSLCAQNPPKLNSSITLSQSASRSLSVTSWTSNSTDALQAVLAIAGGLSGQSGEVYFQLTPMFQQFTSADGSHTGEVWRFINVIDDTGVPVNATTAWDDYCVSELDPLRYGGVSVNQVVFWRKPGTTQISEIEIPAFQVVMGRQKA